ncbi:hypothetical protein C1H46_043144 [Malus baccata]|uniref:Uncharacterized protein n=1 Tax=Malus baccata TaxID=106549 RepID=A0A540KAS4_MALBA|nr:hypothetical protein C1H46_043144 [Malus baccata]
MWGDWRTIRERGGVWIATWPPLSIRVLPHFFCRNSGSPPRQLRLISPGIAPIQHSPRRKAPRHAVLDAIPEDEEVGKEHSKGCNGMIHHRKLQIRDSEIEEYESEGKIGHHFDSDEMYTGEDGQLTWFNAGVRVGVGISLGIGIGVGLLMRSYQATTSNFRRRFL